MDHHAPHAIDRKEFRTCLGGIPRDRTRALKILIVSWYFPPVNTIGAVRVGKFARFLIERGHDIAVVAGSNWGHPETLPLGIPLQHVIYASWTDVNAWPGMIRQRWSQPY